jgi:uncharacterized protein
MKGNTKRQRRQPFRESSWTALRNFRIIYAMTELIFEWDENKARHNLQKHGISFVAAMAVFEDPRRLERFDLRRNYTEERFQVIGMGKGRVLFVAYTRRGDVIRLISARRANRNERKAYETDRP